MSITGVFNTAVSALQATQQALQVTSTNIANVNTPDYARMRVQLEAQSLEGTGAGVKIGDVQRITDRFLQMASYAAAAQTNSFQTQAEFHDRLQSLLGRPDENTSIANRLDAVLAGVAELEVDPSSPARRLNFITLLNDFGSDVSRLSREIQTLRTEASNQIGQDIIAINAALENVQDINRLIIREKVLGGQTGGLEEDRDGTLRELAKLIDIRLTENPDGSVFVATESGLSLLDATLYQLQYEPPGVIVADTRIPQITLHRIDPSTGIADANGRALDPEISGGRLRGLLDTRDTVMPDIAASLGELAAKVIDQVNGVHNAFSAIPAPNSLTGRNSGHTATDLQSFTGISTFAVVDANGVEVNSVAVDFTALGGAATINDVINAVNAGLGADGTMALTNGVLSLTAANPANGVLIAQDTVAPSDRAGRGFAHFFGMNDVVGSAVSSFYETGLAAGEAHGFGGGQTMRLEFVGPNGETAVDYTMTVVGATFNNLMADLNNPANMGTFVTFSMDASGSLVGTPAAGFEDYSINVIQDNTARSTTGVSMSELFGIGPRYDAFPAKDIAVASRILSDPSLLSLAQYDPAAPAGDPVITPGDARGALAMQALESKVANFSAAGNLPGMNVTLNQYAANVLANTGQLAAQMVNQAESHTTLSEEITSRLRDISGVSLDEELANMVMFQNAYNAAARLITTAQELMDALLDTVR